MGLGCVQVQVGDGRRTRKAGSVKGCWAQSGWVRRLGCQESMSSGLELH